MALARIPVYCSETWVDRIALVSMPLPMARMFLDLVRNDASTPGPNSPSAIYAPYSCGVL